MENQTKITTPNKPKPLTGDNVGGVKDNKLIISMIYQNLENSCRAILAALVNHQTMTYLNILNKKICHFESLAILLKKMSLKPS